MNPDKVVEYIKTEHGKGINHEVIYDKLISSGWEEESVKQAFISVFGYTKSISALRLQSIDLLFNETLKFFTSYWKPIVLILLIRGLLDSSVSFVGQGILIKIPSGVASLLAATLIFIVKTLYQTWIAAIILFCIIHPNRAIKEAIVETRKRLLQFLFINGFLTILLFLGFFILIIPGIIFLVWFSFTDYIFFEEGLSGLQVFKQSYQYVKHYFLDVLIRLFAIGIITLLFGALAGLLIKYVPITMFKTVLGILLSSILMPIPAIYGYLLYQELKKIKVA